MTDDSGRFATRDWNCQLSRWPDLDFLMNTGLTESLDCTMRWIGTTGLKVRAWIGAMLEDEAGSHDPADYRLKYDNKSLARRLDLDRSRIGAWTLTACRARVSKTMDTA